MDGRNAKTLAGHRCSTTRTHASSSACNSTAPPGPARCTAACAASGARGNGASRCFVLSSEMHARAAALTCCHSARVPLRLRACVRWGEDIYWVLCLDDARSGRCGRRARTGREYTASQSALVRCEPIGRIAAMRARGPAAGRALGATRLRVWAERCMHKTREQRTSMIWLWRYVPRGEFFFCMYVACQLRLEMGEINS